MFSLVIVIRYYIGEQIGDTVTTYEEIPALIKKREPFRGHSVSAQYDGTQYQVISYGIRIAQITIGRNDWWINPNIYSKTTSRIQNIVREIDRVERSEISFKCGHLEITL